jgi:hypothetical protein
MENDPKGFGIQKALPLRMNLTKATIDLAPAITSALWVDGIDHRF